MNHQLDCRPIYHEARQWRHLSNNTKLPNSSLYILKLNTRHDEGYDEKANISCNQNSDLLKS